jgi:hypothetical protein
MTRGFFVAQTNGRGAGRRHAHPRPAWLSGSGPAVGPVGLGDSDADRHVVQVGVPAAQARQFPGSHRAVRAEVDHEAPADADRVGEGIHLADGGDTTFRR